MLQVNMLEAKTDLSKLVKMLETKEEEVIYIARNGTSIAQLTLIPNPNVIKRIGIAKGKIKLSKDFDEIFDSLDDEITDTFENGGEI